MANQGTGKAASEIPALKPDWGNPTVRNFREGDGNSGIIEARRAPLPYPTILGEAMETSSSFVSSRQGCESCEVKVLAPPIACSRADSMSDACEGNDARSARMKKPRLPCEETCSGRNDLGGEQTGRPEHQEIAAVPKADPWKIVFADKSGKSTHSNDGEDR